MKRPVFVQIKYQPEYSIGEQFPAEWFVLQVLYGTGVNRCKQSDAAAARLAKRCEVLRLRELIDRKPLRVHAAQQHQHPLALRAAGEHVRTRPEIKLRHTVHRSGQLQPLVHNSHALPGFRERPDTAAQQRRFPTAGRTGKQTGLLQIRKQRLRRMTNRMRNTERKRRDLPQPGHAAVLHNRASANSKPVSARQTEVAASQLLLHGILRLRGGIQKYLLQFSLRQRVPDRQRPLGACIQNRRSLSYPQPKLLDLCLRRAGQSSLYRLRQHAQDHILHSLAPPVQVYCLSAPGIPSS